MSESCEQMEDLIWMPSNVSDIDLMMYLRAARSMAAFVGMCDGGSTEDGCIAASMDETTISVLEMLHNHGYDTGSALQALVKTINPKHIEKRWTEDDAKKFAKGLKIYGKNFFRIRKELLPLKETGHLVEYYYFWKKTAAAATTRPPRRHRRGKGNKLSKNLARQAPSGGEDDDLSSATECSDNDSEDTDSHELGEYIACRNCTAAIPRESHDGVETPLCSECQEDVRFSAPNEPPPFMFKPVQQDEEDDEDDGEDTGTTSSHSGPSPQNIINGNVTENTEEGDKDRHSPSSSSVCSSGSSDSSSSSSSGASSSSSPEERIPNGDVSNGIDAKQDVVVNHNEGLATSVESPCSSSNGSSSGASSSSSGQSSSEEENEDNVSTQQTNQAKQENGSATAATIAALRDEPVGSSHVNHVNRAYQQMLPVGLRLGENTHSGSVQEDIHLPARSDGSHRPAIQGPHPYAGPEIIQRPGSVSPHRITGTEVAHKPPEQEAPSQFTGFESNKHLSLPDGVQRLVRPDIVHPSVVLDNLNSEVSQSDRAQGGTAFTGQQSVPTVKPSQSEGEKEPQDKSVAGQWQREAAAAAQSLVDAGLVPLQQQQPQHNVLPGRVTIKQEPMDVDTASEQTTFPHSSQPQLQVPSQLSQHPHLHHEGLQQPHKHQLYPPSSHRMSLEQSHLHQQQSHQTKVSNPKQSPSLSQSHQPSGAQQIPPLSKSHGLPRPQPQISTQQDVDIKPTLPIAGVTEAQAAAAASSPAMSQSQSSSHQASALRENTSSNPHQDRTTPHIASSSKHSASPAGHSNIEHSAYHSSSQHIPISQVSPGQSAAPPNQPGHPPHPMMLPLHYKHGPHPPPLTASAPTRGASPGGIPIKHGETPHSSSSITQHPQQLPLRTEGTQLPASHGMSLGAMMAAGGRHPPPPPPLVSASPSSSHGPPTSVLAPQPRGLLPLHSPHLHGTSERPPPAPPLQAARRSTSPLHLSMSPHAPQRSQLTPGLNEPQRPRSRSRSPVRETETPESDVPQSPDCEPYIINEKCHTSKHATFIKHWYRGKNSCSRCDFHFVPLPDSKLARRREERQKKHERHSSSSSHTIKEERKEEKKEEEKATKKPGTPPENKTADAQITSSLMVAQHPPTPYGPSERLTPRQGPYLHDPRDPTPALRTLSEYARPHTLGGGVPEQRGVAYPFQNMHSPVAPGMDPYRVAMYPPGPRERLEMELERDKRERDARERDIRERELREIESRERLKHELEMKPPGFERLPHAAGQLDPHWLELQRRYGPGALPPGAHLPGVYHPASIASDMMQRDRERLDRLGVPAGMTPEAAVAAERLSAERLQAERMALATDPLVRLQMAGIQPSGPQHTHTHAHAHTHLHLHQQEAAAANVVAGLHPLAGGQIPGGPHIPGAGNEAMSSAVAAASGPASIGPHLPPSHTLPPNHPLAEASRQQQQQQQEMIYRELMSRSQHNMDPVLVHQLQVQQAHAAHQHEALQRQLVMERERMVAGGPPPHPPPHHPH